MFVTQELTVSTGLREAQARLTNLIHGAWLVEASAAACDGAVTGLLRVGPPGLGTATLVRVSLLDPAYRGDVMTVGLPWEATGAAGGLFPVLDANISISPGQDEGTTDGEDVARLALTGCYQPRLAAWAPRWTRWPCTGWPPRQPAPCCRTWQ